MDVSKCAFAKATWTQALPRWIGSNNRLILIYSYGDKLIYHIILTSLSDFIENCFR